MVTINYITNDVTFTENFKSFKIAAEYVKVFEGSKLKTVDIVKMLKTSKGLQIAAFRNWYVV